MSNGKKNIISFFSMFTCFYPAKLIMIYTIKYAIEGHEIYLTIFIIKFLPFMFEF